LDIFSRRRRAQRARVVATLRSEVRRPLDLHLPPSYHPHYLLKTGQGGYPRTAIECDNKLGSGSSYARHAVVAIQSPTTSPRPNTNRPAAAAVATGDWLASSCERGTRHHPSTKNKNQGGDQGRRHRPVRVAFRLRTVRVHWHRHRTGGLLWELEVYLRRCCGAAAAAATSPLFTESCDSRDC
jgi:hypothetical protein